MSHSPQDRDDTTRYLCAAAHLDADFANDAVREYLIEPTRAIPPSPGVWSGTVLREAVAARTRARLRDGLLLVLLLVVVATLPVLIPTWLGGAALVVLVSGFTRRKLEAALRDPVERIRFWLRVIALLFVIPAALSGPALLLQRSNGSDTLTPPSTDAEITVGTIALLLTLGVLFWDRWIVRSLVTKSFRRGRFRDKPGHDTWAGEWFFRTLGHGAHAKALERHAAPTDVPKGCAQLIVYRSYEPFVGAGFIFEPWSMAFPLKPAEDAGAPMPRFGLPELYDHVTTELLKTGRSASMSPHHRLSNLEPVDRIVVSAMELVDHLGDAEAQIVLPDGTRPPVPWADQRVVDDLINRPLEWMRHFRCFELETWDRDIVVSMYLTFGLDDEMLYVEWTPCVLQPIARRFREIDALPPQSWRLLWEATKDLVRFPTSVPKRIRNAVTWMRPIHVPAGTIDPAKYGAWASLRELAVVSGRQDDYFHITDVARYEKVLESRLLRALGEFLEDKGISVTAFMEQAKQVTNNNVHISGNVIGSNISTRGQAHTGKVEIK